jgi:hypothetical protein
MVGRPGPGSQSKGFYCVFDNIIKALVMANPVLRASGFTDSGQFKILTTLFLVVFATGTALNAYNTILEIKLNKNEIKQKGL